MIVQMSNIEDRLQSLERHVSVLSSRIDELSNKLITLMNQSSSRASVSKLEKADQLDSSAPVQPDSKTTFLPLDSILRGDLLVHVATACFILVIALVFRILSENNMIPTQAGIVLGIAYCVLLILWNLSPLAVGSSVTKTVGGCGFLVLCLVVFESYKYFNGLSIPACFAVLLFGMLTSVLSAWKHQSPSFGRIGLLLFPTVFLALSYPAFANGWLITLLVISMMLAYVGHVWLELSPARSGVALLVLVVMILWQRQLNALYYNQGDVYPGSTMFLSTVIGFSVLLYIPSLISAWVKRSLSPFEKAVPSLVVILAYGFCGSELFRQGIPQPLHAQVGFILSALIIMLGIGFGIRNAPERYGLRTFLCAGVILLLFSSSHVFYSLIALTIFWSLCALSLFLLAYFFGSQDLRFLSYLLHVIVFMIVMSKGALFYGDSLGPLAACLPLFLGISLWLHFYLGRAMRIFHPEKNKDSIHWIDRVSILLLLCALTSFFLFGRNVMMAMWDTSPFAICLQSIWLTALAAVTLHQGHRKQKRDIELVGFVFFMAAGVKIFLIDLLSDIGIYFAVGVFTFGIMAGVSSLLMRKTRKAAL